MTIFGCDPEDSDSDEWIAFVILVIISIASKEPLSASKRTYSTTRSH
jgi:hypothetical protein